MIKLEPVLLEEAPVETRGTLEDVAAQHGFVPNLIGTFAQTPAAIHGYVGMQNAFDTSSLSATEKYAVLLAVSVANGGEYCVPVHSSLAAREGINQALVTRLRAGQLPDDARLAALVNFTMRIVRNRGKIDKKDVDHFLRAGFSKSQIMDVILGVAMKTMSNYANHIFDIDIDPAFKCNAWTPVDQGNAA